LLRASQICQHVTSKTALVLSITYSMTCGRLKLRVECYDLFV
jgi:hypothetical protein